MMVRLEIPLQAVEVQLQAVVIPELMQELIPEQILEQIPELAITVL